MIAVCIPSRGLVHSRTMQHVIANLKGQAATIFITNDSPLPDCFNELTERAMATNASHLFFVEEDQGFPDNTLKELLALDTDIATMNYPAGEMAEPVVKQQQKFTQHGTGCMLVKRRVFEKMRKPYFRNVLYDTYTWEPVVNPHAFAGHDIDFAKRTQEAGFKLGVIDTEGWQYRLKSLGKHGDNQGFHKITELRF